MKELFRKTNNAQFDEDLEIPGVITITPCYFTNRFTSDFDICFFQLLRGNQRHQKSLLIII